ncbi:hypothetical protein [Nocardia brasiliensis]|uniref:hypothetical protein n=1 Tax=Nocardia brasiliensis TaxID=37326 RepID=UPI00245395D2|nr:hypothetical protein [Nocardia brasiliensis]
MTIRAQDASRTATTMLDDIRMLVEPAYLASLHRLAPPLRVIVAHHIGRNDRMGCWDRGNDTYIGSALVLAAAKAAGADDPQYVSQRPSRSRQCTIRNDYARRSI